MGFGILFLGYFLGFIMPLGTPALLRLLGCFVTGFAAFKLRAYCRRFNSLISASVVTGAFYGVFSVFEIMSYLGFYTMSDSLQSVFMYAGVALTVAYQLCMLISVRYIAKDTDCEEIVFAATRNIVFHGIFLALMLITLLPYAVAKNMLLLAIILYFVLWIFDLAVVFRCYAQICDENDVEMRQKPSRFAFVNSFREQAEQRRQQVEAEREEIREKRQRQRKKRRK